LQIRETLNSSPILTVVITIGVIGAALFVALRFGLGGRGPKPPPLVKQYYFTTDDGSTFFADDKMKVPPFKRDDGQEAVRAHVFSSESDKTPFVGYLERFADEYRAQVEAADPQERLMLEGFDSPALEVKKPGEGNRWVGASRKQEFDRIRLVKDPHDSTKYARETWPNRE
jgi:hypothetical protein